MEANKNFFKPKTSGLVNHILFTGSTPSLLVGGYMHMGPIHYIFFLFSPPSSHLGKREKEVLNPLMFFKVSLTKKNHRMNVIARMKKVRFYIFTDSWTICCFYILNFLTCFTLAEKKRERWVYQVGEPSHRLTDFNQHFSYGEEGSIAPPTLEAIPSLHKIHNQNNFSLCRKVLCEWGNSSAEYFSLWAGWGNARAFFASFNFSMWESEVSAFHEIEVLHPDSHRWTLLPWSPKRRRRKKGKLNNPK